MDSFVYLGSYTDLSGGNDQHAQRRIDLARSCMKTLDMEFLLTKITLYIVYINPVIVYDDVWSLHRDVWMHSTK